MKKIFILLIVLAACFTMQAQTPITVPNGDFSSGNVLLSTGTNPYTVISGWTINAVGNGITNLTTASSGVVSGVFYLKGTASGVAGDVLVTSYPNNEPKQGIDISAIPVGATFTFNCPMKAAGTQNGTPHNLAIKLYDINGLDVTTACTSTSSKSVVAINTSTYTNETAVLVTQANNIGGNNAYYIAIVMQLGKNLLAGVYVDNVTLNYTTNPPILSVGTPTGTALSYEVANGPSAPQSFTVSGTNLTANLFVTPGANIELSSTSGSSGFQGGGVALSLTPSSGTVATTTIYARLVSGLSLGTGGTNAARLVTIATTGTTSQTIQYTATVTGIASSVSGGSAINYIQGAGPSAEKTITVQGGGLTADVVVTPGSNIEISTTTGTGFATTPITLTQAGGAVAATPIYTRLIAGLSGGTYNDATTKVTASSTGFASKEIQFTGTVSANVSATQNISDLALSGAATVNIADGGELNINQNSSSVTMTVSPLAKVTLPDNTTLTSSSITLQSNAGGTATFVDLNNTSPQTVTGTVQQYLTAERNWYTSSPITTGTAAGLNRGTSVQTYSESAKGWTTLLGTDELVNGKGYVSVATASDGSTTGTVSFNGILNSGTVSVPVTRTEAGSSRGFNLVANPYPSYLDWSLVKADGANANIGTTMWFRTKTAGGLYTFSTYNSDGNVAVGNSATTTISKFIPPMQAFWIRVNANIGITTYSTSITFKNSMRAHKDVSGNTFKAPKLNTQQLVRLQISNGTYSDEAVVYFNADALNTYDKYDSQKMFENEDALKPEIFTQIGNEKLVINGLNTIPYNTEIPLGLVTKQVGNFSITANELLNFESGTRVMLKDKLNPAIETELTPETVYNFSSPVTAASTDRFSLIFRAPGVATATNNIGNINTQVFVNAANQITIVAPEKATYSIYNAVGMQLESGQTTGKLQTANCKLQTGVYVVRVNNQSTRVIVK